MNNNRILFGSCHNLPLDGTSHHRHKVWDVIASRNASAFVWGGDAIYGDDAFTAATPSRLREHYAHLLAYPGYRKLLTQPLTVLGVLDDHDYGVNNGDRTYPYRTESGQAFVDFLMQSNNDGDWAILQQRAAEGKGVYGVKVLDFDQPEGGYRVVSDVEAAIEPSVSVGDDHDRLSNKSVAIFLLDVRTHKTPWTHTSFPERYQPDYGGDFLGNEQWEWLQSSLARSEARVNIVVQGLQVHADRFFGGETVESWSSYPRAQHRLYQTLVQQTNRTPFLISGDVHMAQLLRRDCRRKDDDATSASVSLIEVTASGLTHAWCAPQFWARDSSLTPLFRSCAWLRQALCTGMHTAQQFMNDLVVVEDGTVHEGTKLGRQYSLDINFAEFEFDWENEQVIVRILGDALGEPPALSTRWSMGAQRLASARTTADFAQLQAKLQQHGVAQPDDWICVSYNGEPTMFHKIVGAFVPISVALTLMLAPLVVPAVVACFLLRPSKRLPSTS